MKGGDILYQKANLLLLNEKMYCSHVLDGDMIALNVYTNMDNTLYTDTNYKTDYHEQVTIQEACNLLLYRLTADIKPLFMEFASVFFSIECQPQEHGIGGLLLNLVGTLFKQYCAIHEYHGMITRFMLHTVDPIQERYIFAHDCLPLYQPLFCAPVPEQPSGPVPEVCKDTLTVPFHDSSVYSYIVQHTHKVDGNGDEVHQSANQLFRRREEVRVYTAFLNTIWNHGNLGQPILSFIRAIVHYLDHIVKDVQIKLTDQLQDTMLVYHFVVQACGDAEHFASLLGRDINANCLSVLFQDSRMHQWYVPLLENQEGASIYEIAEHVQQMQCILATIPMGTFLWVRLHTSICSHIETFYMKLSAVIPGMELKDKMQLLTLIDAPDGIKIAFAYYETDTTIIEKPIQVETSKYPSLYIILLIMVITMLITMSIYVKIG